DFANTFLP
nr:Chain C, HEV-1 [Henipavirus hendraense]6ILE_C Chain C, HEV-1 [Henipavirus hendraense]6J2D_C Chain C, HeV1 [Henipavirus hendraense]6J2H_C Chain C, HeV1 [Henipavirus hendraense]6J2H_F Chain F, HeV1 [Henipavirus hendraense]6K7T_C Chain C, HeV1 [Henipavirus hendraense]